MRRGGIPGTRNWFIDLKLFSTFFPTELSTSAKQTNSSLKRSTTKLDCRKCLQMPILDLTKELNSLDDNIPSISFGVYLRGTTWCILLIFRAQEVCVDASADEGAHWKPISRSCRLKLKFSFSARGKLAVVSSSTSSNIVSQANSLLGFDIKNFFNLLVFVALSSSTVGILKAHADLRSGMVSGDAFLSRFLTSSIVKFTHSFCATNGISTYSGITSFGSSASSSN
mmetsp:Transcript_10680/g.14838  ORF Transcript_10680/g.14838 Transcript_10680/m.14838 type:complete len:226 (+) Transcript_10680:3-680(+)